MTEIAGRWLRVSTAGQDERDQEPDIDRWIHDHGYGTGPTYRLHGRSAYKGQQDADLDRVISDMSSGVIQVLIVWQSSRIERRGAYNAFDLARRVREAGGRIEYVKDAHLNATNDMSDVALAMNATMDRLSSKAKSDAVLKAHAARRAANALVGRAPWGYRIVPAGDYKTLQPDPELAQFIREAVARYLTGASLRAVCVWLDSVGAKPYSAATWDPAVLARTFRNHILIGRRVNAKGKTDMRLDPIIDRATWDRLQAELDRKANRKGIVPANSALLTGVAVCAGCGGPMYRIKCTTAKRDGTKSAYLYYRCHGTARKPSQCRNMVRLDDLDQWLDSQLLANPGFVVERVTIPGHGHDDEIAEVERDLRELDFDAPDYAQRHADLLAERRRLVNLPATPATVQEEVLPMTVGDMWRELDPAERRGYLIKSGVQVLVSKDIRRMVGDPGLAAVRGIMARAA